jgi:predicted secreted protein
MMLRGIAALWIAGLMASLSSIVQAGDRADFELVGFSQDGRYFAFEEYGVQDGSGFAYSSFYVIDLLTDSWVEGTPVRRQSEFEASLAATRGEARQAALDALESVDIEVPATLLALNGDGDPRSNGLTLDYGAPGFSGQSDISGAARLSLEIFKAPAYEACEDYLGEPAMGFALIHRRGGTETELFRDTKIPRSRGCPITYKLFAVAVPFPGYDLVHSVALISVYRFGFEGADRRFIAIPVSR